MLIDLALQARQAYRHVIYNGDYAKLILKMALLAIISDGYIDWASLPNAGKFFEQGRLVQYYLNQGISITITKEYRLHLN